MQSSLLLWSLPSLVFIVLQYAFWKCPFLPVLVNTESIQTRVESITRETLKQSVSQGLNTCMLTDKKPPSEMTFCFFVAILLFLAVTLTATTGGIFG